jgi:RNA polymerase sigma-70 factor (ECF subfamily)
MRTLDRSKELKFQSDEALVRAFGDGEKAAFEALVERYQGRVFAIALARIGDRDAALDIAQNTFIKAYQSMSTLKDPDNFAAWVARIALNFALSHLRRSDVLQRVQTASEWSREAAASPSPEDEASAKEMRDIARKLIGSLPDELRAIATLRYMESMTLKEIGLAVDKPLSTIQNKLAKARQLMRGELRRMREEQTSNGPL